jgi:hypothetical protein
MKCPGPGVCPFSTEARFRKVVWLVVLLLLCMTLIALAAVLKGKDGILTSSVCAAMATSVTAVLLGGLRAHERHQSLSQQMPKGGDTNGK